MAKKINTTLYKSTGGGFDMSKLPTANILREIEVTAKKPVRPVAVRDQTSLVNLQQMDEFEVVANRINRPQAGIEKPQSNALINGYRLAPEGGIRNRDIVEAFKPEFDAELALDNDSTTAFNNMLEKRNINAPRTRSIGRYRENYRNNYNPEFIRRILINQSNNYKPL